MGKIRFETAREVFEAFPTAQDDINATPTDDPPLAFLTALADTETPEDAIGFCAYLLPRREGVWWASQCVRSLLPGPAADEEASLAAAEAWVREPGEPRRRAALTLGMASDKTAPTTWIALAAGWAGGAMHESEHGAVAAPPHLTAKAARAAVLTALARVGAKERATRLRACLDSGIKLARDG